MIVRSLKWGLAVATGAILVGGLLFGRDLASYVRYSVRGVQQSVAEAIPIDVELERARQLIEDILPELRANVRVIAQEEVEVAHLRKEIEAASENAEAQRHQVSLLRQRLETSDVQYVVNQRRMSREQLVERLAGRLDRSKQAEAELASKQRLLETREQSLSAAQEMLDKSRARKAELEQKINSLVAQHRLVKAQAVASKIHIDDSQLARADRLMTNIEKRLQTAQRVLSHEAELVTENFDEIVSEEELLAEVDSYLIGNQEKEVMIKVGADQGVKAEIELQ